MVKLILLTTTFILLASNSIWAETIDSKNSIVSWEGGKEFTKSKHNGNISIQSQTLSIKNGNLESGEIVFNMNSITNKDLSGKWNSKLVAHLKSKDFFNVTLYPTSKLVIKKVTLKSDTAMIQANLTIKDITNPISFSARRIGDNIVGQVSFDRIRWGVQYGSKESFSLSDLAGKAKDKVIKNNILITFQLLVIP